MGAVEPRWLTVARGELGTREIEGPKSNSRIVEYSKVAVGTAAPDSEAWCAKFVGWCLASDDDPETRSTRSAAARSYDSDAFGPKLDGFRLGCVAVFYRGGRSGWKGHVGFAVREDAAHVWVVGGNQGNAVSIARYPKSGRSMGLLSYRWPKRAPPPPPPAAAHRDAELEQVQQRLKDLGYHEVGAIDGLWGGSTRSAVRHFYDDWNDRNPDESFGVPAGNKQDDLVTAAFRDALMRALPKQVAPERETAAPEKIEDYAAVGQAKKVGAIGKIGAVITGGVSLDQVTGATDKLSQVSGVVSTLKSSLTNIVEVVAPLWPFALLAVTVFLIIYGRRIWKEEIESYRAGETP